MLVYNIVFFCKIFYLIIFLFQEIYEKSPRKGSFFNKSQW